MLRKKIALLLALIPLTFFSTHAYSYDPDDGEYYDDWRTDNNFSQRPIDDIDHYTNSGDEFGPDYAALDDGEADVVDYRRPPQRYAQYERRRSHYRSRDFSGFAGRMPAQIAANGERVIIVNPRVHAWAAYEADGTKVHGGIASSGANYCRDIHRRCHTSVGSFRIFSLGGPGCKSTRYPLGRGGAPMPYCMYFNRNQGLHGSYELGDANLSHGCVRLNVGDAEWLRYNFARVGTKVIIKPY